MLKILFVGFLLLGSISCSPIFGVYGIRNPKVLTDKSILRQAKRLNMPLEDVYVLDTNYFDYLFGLDSTVNYAIESPENQYYPNTFKTQVKNHYQPLQAIYLDSNDVMVSFHVNCFAGGFPNLHWLHEGERMSFPPPFRAPLDSLLSINLLQSFMHPLHDNQHENSEKVDFTIIVIWNKFMGRQNRRFINFIQASLALAEGQSIRVYYVNADGAFVYSALW